MIESDEVLVGRARQGERAAFEELVRRTSRLVFARLYLETGDAHQAEDLAQETYLLAFRGLSSLSDPKGFRSWLLRTAQNAARRGLRKKRARPTAAGNDALAGVASHAPDPEEIAAKEEQRSRVLSVLRSLPDEYRLPLTLRYLGDVDYEEIQMQLGLTNGSLRGMLHRGLKMLRERMKE